MIPKAGDVVPGQRRDAGGGEPIGPVAMIPAVAMIPVYGTLVKRSSNVDAESGLTSYAALRSKVDAAMKSPIVKSLLFDMDSAGGEVSGLFDFCSYLGSVRGTKPMIGIANDMAFSAAYAVASCMDKLFITSVAGAGSIGVYMLHVDVSKMDEKQGVAYTYIQAGSKKTDMNPHQPLSNRALAEAQGEVDRIRDMFVELVAKNRKVDPKKIYDTEAGTFMGSQAVPLLADAVGSFDECMRCVTAFGPPADIHAAARSFRAWPKAPSREEAALRARFAKLRRNL
jgi:ClpP class serine protease